MGHGRVSLGLLAAVVATASGAARAEGDSSVRVLPDVSLEALQGGAAPVVDEAQPLTALVFFRAGHERSTDTLRMLASCRGLAKEPVRLLGVVPADSAASAGALVASSGLALPVVVDADETLYGAAGVHTHPAIVLVDRERRVVAAEPFHQVGFCDVVVARVQRALGKIGDAEVARVLAPAPTRLPGADEPLAVAHRHVALARRLLAERSFAKAHENVRRALALAASAEAWRVEGEIFAAERRCPDALRAFDSALALDPEDAGASSGRRACSR